MRSVLHKAGFLEEKPFYGDALEKRKIPLIYGVSNLRRVELSGFWRMLYTISINDEKRTCFILDILNHKKYDKTFGYKKK